MIVSTSKPTGVMRTDRMYENCIVELEWRHMKPGGNAGLFLWGDGVPSVGIPFTRGIEVEILDNAYDAQGKNERFTTHGDIFPIHSAKMTPVGEVAANGKRSFPLEERSKSSPEWNHYRVVADKGEIRLSVNGKEVTVGKEWTLESDRKRRLVEEELSNRRPQRVFFARMQWSQQPRVSQPFLLHLQIPFNKRCGDSQSPKPMQIMGWQVAFSCFVTEQVAAM